MKQSITLAAFSVLTVLAASASAGHYDSSHRDRYDRNFERTECGLSGYRGRDHYSYSRRTLSDDYLRRGLRSDYRYENVRYDNRRYNTGYNRDRRLRDGYAENRYNSNRDRYQRNQYRRSNGFSGLLGLLTGRGLGTNGYYNQ